MCTWQHSLVVTMPDSDVGRPGIVFGRQGSNPVVATPFWLRVTDSCVMIRFSTIPFYNQTKEIILLDVCVPLCFTRKSPQGIGIVYL